MTQTLRWAFLGAIFLGLAVESQSSLAQDSWNHGFGPRNYGYNGNPYSQSYATPNYSNSANLGFGYTNGYVTGFNPYYGVYPYYAYDGVGLGVYPNGFYSYQTGPYYGYGYNYYAPYGNYMPYRGTRVNPNAHHPKQTKKGPQGAKKPGEVKNADKKTPLHPSIAF